MGYFVGHMCKVSGGAGGLENHNERKTENHKNKNIDILKKDENIELIERRQNSNLSYQKEFNKLIKEKYDVRTKTGKLKKIRKDAVKFNSFVFSASPEVFESLDKKEQIRYFETCKKYMETKIDPEKIITAKIHFDEITPHMHLITVPLTEKGELSSKKIYTKQFLKNFQEECPKFLRDEGFEIERGKDAKGVNKRVEDLDYQLKKLEFKEKEIEFKTINFENLDEFKKKRKLKLNIFNEVLYKVTEKELNSFSKLNLEKNNLEKSNRVLTKELEKIKNNNKDNLKLEYINKVLKKRLEKNGIETIVEKPKIIFKNKPKNKQLLKNER